MTGRTRFRRITDTQLLYDLLPMIADGASNTMIAGEIGLSVDGTKDRVRALLHHLEAKNRAHAVAIAYQRGLLFVPTGTAPARPKDHCEPATFEPPASS